VQLGTFGIWTTHRTIGEENAGEAARIVETVATGMVNVWQNDPATLAAEHASLLGAGVGVAGAGYG
jgi:hypothetical protein